MPTFKAEVLVTWREALLGFAGEHGREESTRTVELDAPDADTAWGRAEGVAVKQVYEDCQRRGMSAISATATTQRVFEIEE